MPENSPVQRQECQGVPLPPETEKGPNQARKSRGLSAEINHPIPPAQTRQRKRTINAALAMLDGSAAAGIWSLPQALPLSFRKVEGR